MITTELVNNCKAEDFYFKVLAPKRKAPFRKRFEWPRVGVWTKPIVGVLRECSNGYHLARPRDLFRWLTWKEGRMTSHIYLVEASSDKKTLSNKVVTRKARLLKKLSWNQKIHNQALKKVETLKGKSRVPARGYYGETRTDLRSQVTRLAPHNRKKFMKWLMEDIWGVKLGPARKEKVHRRGW